MYIHLFRWHTCAASSTQWQCRLRLIFLAVAHLALCAQRAAASDNSGTGADGRFAVGLFIRPDETKLQSLQKLALEVSDPTSDKYGHYLQQQELVQAIDLDGTVGKAAATWLQSALRSVGGLDDDAQVTIVSHQDAAYMSSRSFEATYKLGLKLDGVKVGEAGLAPPKEVELLVTPPMPDHWCEDHNETDSNGNLTCPQPCVRKLVNVTSKSGRKRTEYKCKGESGGWQCWPNWSEVSGAPKWICWDVANPNGTNSTASGSSTARRPQRLGKVWTPDRFIKGDAFEHAAQLEIPLSNKSNSSNETNITTTAMLRFRLRALSGGMALYTKGPFVLANTTATLSFRQSGALRSMVLESGSGACKQLDWMDQECHHVVPALENLRPVDHLAVCHNGEASKPEFANAVCICNATLGKDGYGRPCVPLHNGWPQQAPAESILPAPPQALAETLAALGVPKLITARSGENKQLQQAVGEFNLQAFSAADLRQLHAAFGLDTASATWTALGPHKGPITDGNALEGALDMQFMTTVASDAPTAWIGIHPNFIDGFMLAYCMRLNNEVSPPLVHSISWAAAETDFVPAFVRRLDYELMKLALRGVSMMVSSGDNGINSMGAHCHFTSSVIGHSPWVTTVGATMPSLAARPYCMDESYLTAYGSFYPNCEERGPIVCSSIMGSLITSTGGWSVMRDMPAYQAAAVEHYLAIADEVPAFDPRGLEGPNNSADVKTKCTSSGDHCPMHDLLRRKRVAADVSAPGFNFAVVLNGTFTRVDGTSAASPVFAAMVTLLNAEQRRKGRPPLGFLNPWLYHVHSIDPGAFDDVTVGNNSATEETRCRWGFTAAPGWDPPTGCGVPQFAKLLPHLPHYSIAVDQELSGASLVERGATDFGAIVVVSVASGAIAIFFLLVRHVTGLSVFPSRRPRNSMAKLQLRDRFGLWQCTPSSDHYRQLPRK
mmetsp:Transcript_35341/g.82580  ORF Transcript_35341/g.82580 Transcript_35341/m.82580 type:complete len:946 (-) Transcript_35341:91-2928(-)